MVLIALGRVPPVPPSSLIGACLAQRLAIKVVAHKCCQRHRGIAEFLAQLGNFLPVSGDPALKRR
jgi:hypothetical protein